MSLLTYGFIDQQHNADKLVTTIGEQAVYDMIAESLRIWSSEVQEMFGLLVGQTTDWQRRVKIATDADLQSLDEFGQPAPIRVSGEYTQGYPLRMAGVAWGTNRVSRHTLTVAEADRLTATVLKADLRWMRRHLLASMFTKTTYTFADPEHGDLSVVPFANNDTVVYLKRNGTAATANHYTAQADAIDDTHNPFPTIYSTLQGYDSNYGKPVICYVNSALAPDIEALAGFLEVVDPDITVGVSSNVLSGRIDIGPGKELIGKTDRCWIVEWDAVPDDYILAIVPQTEEPIVLQRNSTVEALRGFFPEQGIKDGNWNQLNMIRYAGFGVNNRIAGLCHYIGAADYANPSNLSAPLAA